MRLFIRPCFLDFLPSPASHARWMLRGSSKSISSVRFISSSSSSSSLSCKLSTRLYASSCAPPPPPPAAVAVAAAAAATASPPPPPPSASASSSSSSAVAAAETVNAVAAAAASQLENAILEPRKQLLNRLMDLEKQKSHEQAAATTTTTSVSDVGCGGRVPVNLEASGLPVLDRLSSWTRIYLQLSKARLSTLVVSTTLMGYWMAGGPVCDNTLAYTIVGTALCASAANTFNQVIEVNSDREMKRTKNRPIPSGRISRTNAALVGVGSTVAGVTVLSTMVNPLTAAIGASTIALYALAYTPLKMRHPVNTWIGAVVGALPPVMGYSAVFGTVPVSASILALSLYFWQMPHFFALAYMCRDDYAGAGYKMLSVTHPDKVGPVTLRNAAYLYSISALAPLLDVCSPWFALNSALLTTAFVVESYRFSRNTNKDTARRVFKMSLLYLPILMGLLVYHRLPQEEDKTRFGLFFTSSEPATSAP